MSKSKKKTKRSENPLEQELADLLADFDEPAPARPAGNEPTLTKANPGKKGEMPLPAAVPYQEIPGGVEKNPGKGNHRGLLIAVIVLGVALAAVEVLHIAGVL